MEAYYYVVAYFRSYLFPTIKEAFIRGKESFIEYLWGTIKADVETTLQEIKESAYKFLDSTEYEVKEKFIIEAIFEKVKIPFFLKPIFKRILKKKIRKVISESIEKFSKKLDKKA